MKNLKFLFIPALLFSLLLFNSCEKETRQDISEKVDTVTSKIGKEIDTIADKISSIGEDTLFKGIKITDVDTSGMADESLRSKLNSVFDEYVDIKEALANNNSSEASMQANQLKKSLENIKDDDVNAKMKNNWSSATKKLETSATKLASDTSLSKQRQSFSQLSNDVLSLIKSFGLQDKTIYQLECSGTGGGMWLTDSQNSDNPYASVETDTKSAGNDKAAGEKNVKKENCAKVKDAWKFN